MHCLIEAAIIASQTANQHSITLFPERTVGHFLRWTWNNGLVEPPRRLHSPFWMWSRNEQGYSCFPATFDPSHCSSNVESVSWGERSRNCLTAHSTSNTSVPLMKRFGTCLALLQGENTAQWWRRSGGGLASMAQVIGWGTFRVNSRSRVSFEEQAGLSETKKHSFIKWKSYKTIENWIPVKRKEALDHS